MKCVQTPSGRRNHGYCNSFSLKQRTNCHVPQLNCMSGIAVGGECKIVLLHSTEELAICNHTIQSSNLSVPITYECSVFSLFVAFAASLLLLLGFCCFYCLESKDRKWWGKEGGIWLENNELTFTWTHQFINSQQHRYTWRQVSSLCGHHCNALIQLFSVHVISSYLLEWGNSPKLFVNIFWIGTKIWQ